MDLGKLSQNEKLALYGSIAAVVGGIAGALSGLLWLAVLAAIAMLAVIFLPQLSPSTTLPGSKGSLMLICGGIAAVAGVLALLTFIGAIDFWFRFAPLQAILFLIGVAGSLLMGWAGWQAFQAEGGKFQVGTGSSGSAAATATRTDAPAADTSAPPRDEPAGEPETTDEPEPERREPPS
jgi:hypothetical protein